MTRRIVVLLSILTLVASGCSSTSKRGSPAAATSSSDATGSRASTNSSVASSPGASTTQDPRNSATSGQGKKDVGLSSPSGFTGNKSIYYGPPLTSDIKIGFTVFDNTGVSATTGSAGNSSTSGNGDEQTNLKAEIQALVAYANATGGVGGRKIVGIPYTLSLADIDQNRRVSHCVSATEDDHIQAYIDNNGYFTETDFSCFASHHVTYVGWAETTTRAYLEQNAPYINTTFPAADRLMVALADGLYHANYFKGVEKKVGVVIDDVPNLINAYNKVMVPRLASYGVTPYAIFKINPTDQSSQATQCSNAVLQFQGHVTNVIMLVNVLGFLSCSGQAESQQYRPRYGLGDYQLLASGAAGYGQTGQLTNAVAVSSIPGIVRPNDEIRARSGTDDVRMQDPYVLPGYKQCVRIYTKYRHVDYSKGSSPRSSRWWVYCDHFLLWLDAARKIGAPLTTQNWGQGLAQIGTYESTQVHDDLFDTGVHDGASTYRVGVYAADVSACSCYRLLNPTWFQIPR